MPTINLLYKREYEITDRIRVQIPEVGQVLEHEEDYYNLVSLFTSTPIDFIAELDEAGIDFTKINEYELLLYVFPAIAQKDTSIMFGDLDFTKFRYATSEKTNMPVLLDCENDIVIYRIVHMKIADTLRKLHHLEKNNKKPANDEAKNYLLDRARKKKKRKKKKSDFSYLESLIISAVNTSEFKYDYESVRHLTIYQFNESVKQVARKIDFDNRMHGVYSGTIDVKELKQDDLSWIVQR